MTHPPHPAVADTLLPITEIFGPTIQGEGPSAGQPAAFIRLGGCNLTCRTCDTPYTWDASRYRLRDEITPMTVEDITAKLPTNLPPLTIVTGGEPLLYQHRTAFHQLVDTLRSNPHHRVEIETNGTLAPHPGLAGKSRVRFHVSPKLAGPMSDDPTHKRLVPAALTDYADLTRHGHAIIKFVAANSADVHAAATLAHQYSIPPTTIWIMPEGVTGHTTLTNARQIADTVLDHGFNLTLRQHLLLWPNILRGR